MAEETPAPRCPVCCGRMPTPAHVFLHQQMHDGMGAWLKTGRLRQLPMVLYDEVARLMQDFHESMKA